MTMDTLLAKLEALTEKIRAERKELAQHAELAIGEVTVQHILGGMRGLTSLLCDTSTVIPDEGLRIRNIPILELVNAYPEDVFFLLLTGEFPTEEEKQEIRSAFAQYSNVPYYVWNTLEALPPDTHPMVMLSIGILAMERESRFRQAYESGMPRQDLWKPMLEDAIILLSRITTLAAGIYRMRFAKGDRIPPSDTLDWGANYAAMLGLPDPNGEFTQLIRMYLVLHSDHGGGNVSAFSANTVSSALSNIYYALSAGFNGLAGPLHGLANQEVLRFVLDIFHKYNGVPTAEQLRDLLWDRLHHGQVIPGFGHAVLRVTDPRFTAFHNFGKTHCADDPIFQIVDLLYETAPKVLMEHGKAKNPWPNVDAASGSLLYHYGMTEYEFYTVMFAVSRALGISAQLILNRMALAPIIRPKAITTEKLKELIAQKVQQSVE